MCLYRPFFLPSSYPVPTIDGIPMVYVAVYPIVIPHCRLPVSYRYAKLHGSDLMLIITNVFGHWPNLPLIEVDSTSNRSLPKLTPIYPLGMGTGTRAGTRTENCQIIVPSRPPNTDTVLGFQVTLCYFTVKLWNIITPRLSWI